MTCRKLVVMLALAALTVLAAGCAKKTPVEVTDVMGVLDAAKRECASVYAGEELAAVEGNADEMNALVADKKMKKAKQAAESLRSELEALLTRTESRRAEAKRGADAAIAAAGKELDAARQAGAEQFASREYADARAKLDQAKAKAGDPCGYLEAKQLADEAAAAAKKASAAAIAEKKRREEEERRLREEEERRRREEEERRRREEELRRKPPTWTVEQGQHLWGISGMDKIYGDPRMWPLIFDANRDKISDPDLIYPGQQLTIPRNMSEQQMKDRLFDLYMEMQAEE